MRTTKELSRPPHRRVAAGIGGVLALVTCGLVLAISPQAIADPPLPPQAISGPQAKFYGYLTPVIVITKGETLAFTNIDLDQHNFVQDVEVDGFGGPKKMSWCDGGHHHAGHGKAAPCPLFWSKLVGLNGSTPVEGLKNVESGKTYSFFCTLHHGMKGKLIVR